METVLKLRFKTLVFGNLAVAGVRTECASQIMTSYFTGCFFVFFSGDKSSYSGF